ncbi:MAG: putative toxin-antitoxin system toxin component, PIN family [Thermodesulfobacteriota bacterium]
MRVVLDTNVFISGIFFSGPPAWILKAWEKKKIQMVISQEMLFEYQKVARELSSQFPAVDILPIVELITIHGEFVDTKGVHIAICEDPDDNKFIECAIAGNCTVIVSGDKHLLKLGNYKGVNILTPRHFADGFLR